jgi:hypothetical protein
MSCRVLRTSRGRLMRGNELIQHRRLIFHRFMLVAAGTYVRNHFLANATLTWKRCQFVFTAAHIPLVSGGGEWRPSHFKITECDARHCNFESKTAGHCGRFPGGQHGSGAIGSRICARFGGRAAQMGVDHARGFGCPAVSGEGARRPAENRNATAVLAPRFFATALRQRRVSHSSEVRRWPRARIRRRPFCGSVSRYRGAPSARRSAGQMPPRPMPPLIDMFVKRSGAERIPHSRVPHDWNVSQP